MANFTEKIKQIKLKDVAYPAMSILGIIVFVIIFGLTVKFLFDSTNQVFAPGAEEDGLVRFDIDGFDKISDKLRIKQ